MLVGSHIFAFSGSSAAESISADDAVVEIILMAVVPEQDAELAQFDWNMIMSAAVGHPAMPAADATRAVVDLEALITLPAPIRAATVRVCEIIP
jgi:hypothetical protein